jgi:GT2 family glycosyltransferase
MMRFRFRGSKTDKLQFSLKSILVLTQTQISEPAKLIGVILVMYKQKHNLAPLYQSLSLQSEKNFRLYFVDNNPDAIDADFSGELNEDMKLDIVYMNPGSNTGFAGGNNLGAAKAIADGCEYIFFLNNDTVLDSNCLLYLKAALDSNPHASGAAPLILFGLPGKHAADTVQEFGAAADFRSYKISKNFTMQKYDKIKDHIPGILEVDLISGGAAFFRSAALRKTGLWEESYFAYGDEIDLAKRMHEKGYISLAVKNAVLWHNHKWDKNNKQGYYFEYYLIQRNKYLYFRKFKLFKAMSFSLLIDILKFPWRLIWFIKVCGFSLGFYYLRGTFAGLMGSSGKPKLNFQK